MDLGFNPLSDLPLSSIADERRSLRRVSRAPISYGQIFVGRTRRVGAAGSSGPVNTDVKIDNIERIARPKRPNVQVLRGSAARRDPKANAAGKNVDAFVRVIKPPKFPFQILKGNKNRQPVPAPQAGKNQPRRIAQPAPFPTKILRANASRRGPYANAAGTSIEKFKRFAHQVPFPKNLLAGNVSRRNGHAAVVTILVETQFERFAAPKRPNPSVLRGEILRRVAKANQPGKNTNEFHRVLHQPPPNPNILWADSSRQTAKADKAGKDVNTLRRVLHQPPPNPNVLGAKCLRRNAPPPLVVHYIEHRILYSKRPDPSVFKGKCQRRGGVSQNIFPYIAQHVIRRFLKSKRPSPSVFRGHVVRRDGIAASIYARSAAKLYRFLKSKRPSPSVFKGKVKRRGGKSANNFPPINFKIIHRSLKSKKPHPSTRRGHVQRRDGFTNLQPTWVQFSQVWEQGFRIADDSKAIYELFVGEDGPPDFNVPVATSLTLPITWTPTPPGVGTKTLHIVLRKRNSYNLQSFNVYETIRVIDAAGDDSPMPVSAPFDVTVYDDTTGYIRVLAKYVSLEDEFPADEWDVYVSIGVDPVVGVDTPVYTGDMPSLGVEAGLNTLAGPYTPGTVAHVTVVARRESDGESAAATTILHTLAPTLDLTDGNLFGGASYEQL